MADCLFCNVDWKTMIYDNDTFYSKLDGFPVTKGHSLIIPKRHINSLEELTEQEKVELFDILKETKAFLNGRYNPDGFNVGINMGEAAGQTIMHLHIHLIPRYLGDVPNPKGGVRNVIPEKGDYTTKK